ncbi:hypothetical protein [Mesorhizobium sp. 1B3]|uniref:hypothetical protein n=1 Tax=Mesorhizobium sp. 1B3 TaxID=3243599 RepID=UPI003D9975C3
MAEVSSGSGAASLRALLNQGLIRTEAPGVDALEGMRRKIAEAATQTIVARSRLDPAQNIVSQDESDGEEWSAETQGSHGYLPNASTFAGDVAASPASDARPMTAGIADETRPAHAVNGDQRATSLRSHLVWQEDQFDDGDDGIYSPILRVTRRADANL